MLYITFNNNNKYVVVFWHNLYAVSKNLSRVRMAET